MPSKMPWAQKRAIAPRITVALIPIPVVLVPNVRMDHAVRNGAGVVGQPRTAANVANQIVGPRRAS